MIIIIMCIVIVICCAVVLLIDFFRPEPTEKTENSAKQILNELENKFYPDYPYSGFQVKVIVRNTLKKYIEQEGRSNGDT